MNDGSPTFLSFLVPHFRSSTSLSSQGFWRFSLTWVPRRTYMAMTTSRWGLRYVLILLYFDTSTNTAFQLLNFLYYTAVWRLTHPNLQKNCFYNQPSILFKNMNGSAHFLTRLYRQFSLRIARLPAKKEFRIHAGQLLSGMINAQKQLSVVAPCVEFIKPTPPETTWYHTSEVMHNVRWF